jgi:formylglycine-generating enzyme required for sulfatase activity
VAAGSAVGAALLWAPSGARVVVAAGLAGLAVPLAWSARTAVEVVPARLPPAPKHPPALLEMVTIKGGAFLMGSKKGDRGAVEDEYPQHRVEVGAFLMGKYAVTQAEYEAVTGTNPSAHKGPREPVTEVSWVDAARFCNLLSEREKYERAYEIKGEVVTWREEADGYRLPTEAEWEYAARAGTQTAWSFGDDESKVGEYAWFSQNSANHPRPVGERLPNPWGLFDMHGNAWEWCWDVYGPYSGASRSVGDRALRGGSFMRDPGGLRSARRIRDKPVFRDWSIGFRCARGSRRPS